MRSGNLSNHINRTSIERLPRSPINASILKFSPMQLCQPCKLPSQIPRKSIFKKKPTINSSDFKKDTGNNGRYAVNSREKLQNHESQISKFILVSCLHLQICHNGYRVKEKYILLHRKSSFEGFKRCSPPRVRLPLFSFALTLESL